MEKLVESLTGLENDLGLPVGFCFKLKEEDDWTFIIKTHALLECASAEQITRALGRKELAEVFSQIPMSDTSKGKISFLKALQLLPDAHLKFIRDLSELRNGLVHYVQNVTVDLVSFFADKTRNLKPKQLRDLGNRWAFSLRFSGEEYPPEPLARHYYTPQNELPEGGAWTRVRYLLVQPKLTIWFSALAVLENIALCNWYGPQIWPFLMEIGLESQKQCEEWVHDIFDRAKTGDRDLPERIAQKYERLHPGVRIRRDADGQPDLLSFAAARRLENLRLLRELAERD